jgi:hypothetical protein
MLSREKVLPKEKYLIGYPNLGYYFGDLGYHVLLKKIFYVNSPFRPVVRGKKHNLKSFKLTF